MVREQKIRAVLYYSSLLVFLIGLPLILSFALGYKFDRRTLKFTKTGLIYLKTQPAGASIYLDNKLLNDKTPATLRDLLPGNYHIGLELERHYPWSGDVLVEPSKVSLLDKIILFPLRPDIKQINKERMNYFLIDADKNLIYYVNYEDDSIYVSDLDGGHLEKIADFLNLEPPAVKWKFSPDKGQLLYFNKHQIGITYLGLYKDNPALNGPFVLEYPSGVINDVFWHSDNYHLVIASENKVEVIEAKLKAKALELASLNKKNSAAYYDTNNDALYFIDAQKAYDGSVYDNLYKLELNPKIFSLKGLIKLKNQ